VNDIIHLAGGINPWGEVDARSVPLHYADAAAERPDIVVMSWCGVKVENYRADKVRARPDWADVPAVRHDRIHAISEAFLGRPGPRLVEGYRQLRAAIAAAGDPAGA
jgi:iron complex transport system substrate-binding protein